MGLPGAAPRPVQTPRPVPAPPASSASHYIAHLANIAPRRPLRLRCAPICAELCPNVTIYYIASSAPPPERDRTERDHAATLRRAAPRPDIAPPPGQDHAVTMLRASGLRRRTLSAHCPDIVKVHCNLQCNYNIKIQCHYIIITM